MSSRYGSLTTSKEPADTKYDLRVTFGKWGIAKDNFEIFPYEGRHDPVATVVYWKNGTKQTMSCKRFDDYATNLRALYLALESLRLADQRGILPELAAAAAALLPPGKTRRPAYEVLQVYPEAPIEVAEAAYKALARKLHPDRGGDHEAMKELNDAWAEFKASRDKPAA